METFRQNAFIAAQPAILPRGHYKDRIPAIKKWFSIGSEGQRHLADNYLQRFKSTKVSLELSNEDTDSFGRIEATLGDFIRYVIWRILRRLSRCS
jgi:hypothetical protein